VVRACLRETDRAREREGARSRAKRSNNVQHRAKVDGRHLLPRSTPRGRAGCQYPSSSGVELAPILGDCAARSSHCPRVRLSLEGCTAPEGIARRRMAGACAVSLFLCPKRVEALRLGYERASYDWTGRPSSNLLPCVRGAILCSVRGLLGLNAMQVHCTADLPPSPGWL
jgi:hypothetical protein